MKVKKVVVLITVLVPLLGVAWLLFGQFSPYQICLRHSQAEGIKSGMPAETALAYAEGLCSSKLPLRQAPDKE